MRKHLDIPLVAALVTLAVHVLANAHYGFFRDELYFIICGRHPDWGYVDQPPLVPLLAAATQIFGHSLFLLRVVPALFAAAGAYTTCLLAREFGGGRFAQAFAALIFLGTGVLTSFGGKVSTDEVGLWTWPLIALLVVRITKGADPRTWIAAGVAAGLTLESKYSLIFFLPALALGIVLGPQRRALRSPYFAAGCAVAVAIVLPNVTWQWHHGFPMIELLKNGQNGKNLIASPILFLVQQVLITSLFLAPVWIIGVIWLLRQRDVRFLGIAYIALIVEMIVLHGKHYYPANVYPIVIAAGAVPIERWTDGLRITRAALATCAIVVGLVFAPFAVPVLPEETLVGYAAVVDRALHIERKTLATEHAGLTSALPSDWADMHGWPELAGAVRDVYDSLPPAERAQAVVLADNYGSAAAIQFFTPSVPVISVHNQYWLWGTSGHAGDVLVQIGGTCFRSDRLYASRTVVKTFSSRWGIADEQNLPIAICRKPREPLATVWPDYRSYL